MVAYEIEEEQCYFYDKKRFFIGVLGKLVGVIKKSIFESLNLFNSNSLLKWF